MITTILVVSSIERIVQLKKSLWNALHIEGQYVHLTLSQLQILCNIEFQIWIIRG